MYTSASVVSVTENKIVLAVTILYLRGYLIALQPFSGQQLFIHTGNLTFLIHSLKL